MAVSHVFSNAQPNATGTLTVGYGTNTTTVAASAIVRPQDWNSAHNDYRTFSGNTVGASTWSGTNLVYEGGNNVTLSANGNTLVFSAGYGAGTGFTSTTTAGTAVVATLNSNGLSAGIPAYVTTYDATSGRAGTGFTSTTTAGTAIVGTNNTNGLSLGVPAFITTYVNDLTSGRAGTGFTSTTTAGTAVVATLNTNGLSMGVPAYITTARASNDAIGLNTAGTNVTWTVNSSGLSLNAGGYAGTGFTSTTTAGTAVVGTVATNGVSLGVPAFLTTAANSTHSHGVTLNLTNLAGTTGGNSNGITLSLSATAQSVQPVAASAANGSFNFSTLTFANSNGVSFSTGTQGIFATVATNYLTTARASTDAVGLNTAQTNVTWTVNSSGLSINAAGYAGTATTFAGTNVSASITLNSGGLNLALSGGAGTTNQTGPNIAVPGTTITSGDVVFSNANGVVFGLNGSTMTARVNAMSSAVFEWPGSTSSQTNGGYGTTSASAMVVPIEVRWPLFFNHLKIGFSGSILTTNTSGGHTITSSWGLYTNNAGTLSVLTSSSFSIAITGSGVSGTMSLPNATNTLGYTYTTITWSGSNQAHSLIGTVGRRVADLVFGASASLSPGIYWVGLMNRQSTTGAVNVGYSTAYAGNGMQAAQSYGPMGSSTADFTSNSAYHFGAAGWYTSTGSAGYGGTALPSSMLLNGFNNTLNVRPFMTFMST